MGRCVTGATLCRPVGPHVGTRTPLPTTPSRSGRVVRGAASAYGAARCPTHTRPHSVPHAAAHCSRRRIAELTSGYTTVCGTAACMSVPDSA
eukprot:3132012-Rhodomonas_salina.2